MALGALWKTIMGYGSLVKGQTHVKMALLAFRRSKMAPKDVGRSKLAPESLLKGEIGLKSALGAVKKGETCLTLALRSL